MSVKAMMQHDKLSEADKLKQIAAASQSADEDIDWWSKYYASIGETDKCRFYLEFGYDRLKVFSHELEREDLFEGFLDFCHMFEFNRGKSIEEEESSVVGELKGTFRVYPLPDDPSEELPVRHMSNLPPSAPEECIVRVYIVRALDLQPNDPSGLADPYVSVKLGKKKMTSKDHYIPNSLNPVFGRSFEIKATLPIDKDLLIQVKDYDLLSSDDVIGETLIDLENRYLTKYRATVGLPQTYCISGTNEWRDSKKPKEILEDLLTRLNRPKPEFSGDQSVKIGNREYRLSDFELKKPTHTHLGSADQRLALYLLHVLPGALKNPLVPEHVETRALYNPLQPGIEQGKLQLWVDVFPQSMGEPGPPVDISARTPKRYQLRIIVWNTVDVILEEESITGEMMSDIYVKGWIAGVDDKQETDVHYRSLDGEGNFNWRYVFPFSYVPAEESVVIKKKEHFWSLDETEIKVPPILMIQVWDNDMFSADDFLGTVELNMNRMPKPSKSSGSCKLSQLPDVTKGSDPPTINMFEARRLKGFWPVYNDETGERVLTGKVEMEMELLSYDESELRPAGKGQSEPNENPHLEPPKRPETSFLWFTSPFKTLKFIIWKNYKWYFITGIIIVLVVIFVALFIYNVPGASVTAILG